MQDQCKSFQRIKLRKYERRGEVVVVVMGRRDAEACTNGQS